MSEREPNVEFSELVYRAEQRAWAAKVGEARRKHAEAVAAAKEESVSDPTFQPGVLIGAKGGSILTRNSDGRDSLTFYMEDKYGRRWLATVEPEEVRLSPGETLREGEGQYE